MTPSTLCLMGTDDSPIGHTIRTPGPPQLVLRSPVWDKPTLAEPSVYTFPAHDTWRLVTARETCDGWLAVYRKDR